MTREGEGADVVVKLVPSAEARAAAAQRILDDLPDWFGDPRAKAGYVAASAEAPMLAAWRAGALVGFLSLKRHSPVAAELQVLGVLRTQHRGGCGRALLAAAEALLAPEGVRFLTVKTLGPDNPDECYRRTRLFYEAVGFQPLEVFPTLWGASLPCLMMIKPIGV